DAARPPSPKLPRQAPGAIDLCAATGSLWPRRVRQTDATRSASLHGVAPAPDPPRVHGIIYNSGSARSAGALRSNRRLAGMNPDRALAGQVVLFTECARSRRAFLHHQVVAARA